MPKLQDFRTQHPGISVYLDTDDQYVDFAESDADVALRYGRVPSRELFCESLMSERLIVVAAPSLTPVGSISPASITRLPLLHDQFHPYWDTWAKAAGLEQPNIQSKSSAFPDSAVLIAAAIDGQGAILVRQILVTDDIEAGRLTALGDACVEQERSLHFVCQDGDQRSAPVSALRSWLIETCSQL